MSASDGLSLRGAILAPQCRQPKSIVWLISATVGWILFAHERSDGESPTAPLPQPHSHNNAAPRPNASAPPRCGAPAPRRTRAPSAPRPRAPVQSCPRVPAPTVHDPNAQRHVDSAGAICCVFSLFPCRPVPAGARIVDAPCLSKPDRGAACPYQCAPSHRSRMAGSPANT